MTEMFKDVKFYGIIIGYLVGLMTLIFIVNALLNIGLIGSSLIGFVLSGFILIGISLILVKEDIQQNKPTEYNYEECKELLED